MPTLRSPERPVSRRGNRNESASPGRELQAVGGTRDVLAVSGGNKGKSNTKPAKKVRESFVSSAADTNTDKINEPVSSRGQDAKGTQGEHASKAQGDALQAACSIVVGGDNLGAR